MKKFKKNLKTGKTGNDIKLSDLIGKPLTSSAANDAKNDDVESLHTQILPILKANLPSSLHSLIALGMYLLNPKVLIAEMELCDFRSGLRDHPSLRTSPLDSPFLHRNDFIYDTSKFIKQLERKFMTTIYYAPPFSVKGNSLYKNLTIPDYHPMIKSETHLAYRYLILNKINNQSNTIETCPIQDIFMFNYVYNAPEHHDTSISNDEKTRFMEEFKNTAIPFELRWAITGSDNLNEISIGTAVLYVRIDNNYFLRVQNDNYQVVSLEDIDETKPYYAYVCYERVNGRNTK